MKISIHNMNHEILKTVYIYVYIYIYIKKREKQKGGEKRTNVQIPLE